MADAESDRQAKLGYWVVFVAVVLGTVALGFLVHGRTAAAWRTAGGVLEVFGLGWGALAIDKKVAQLTGRPRFGELIRRRLAAAGDRVRSWLGLGGEGRNIVLEVDPLKVKMSMGEVRGSLRPADDAGVEEWVAYLRRELTALRNRVEEIQEEYDERFDSLADRLEETRRELRAADREVEDLLTRLAIGGFEWELVSLGWFLAGVVVATWGPFLPWP